MEKTMKKLLFVLLAMTSTGGVAETQRPPVLEGGQVRTFAQWKWIANQGETFTVGVSTQVRLSLDYPHNFNEESPSSEKVFRPGTYVCTGSNFPSGDLSTWWKNQICRRLVQEVTVQEYQQQTSGHPYVDNRLDFLPRKGITVQTMGAQSGGAQRNTQAKFRIVCPISRMSNDDPIVHLGQPGRAHHHTFFGAVEIDAFTVVPKSGGSTCAGGTINRSGYWVPSMVDTRFGKALVPFANIIYYQQGYDGVQAASIVAPPRGFRMIADARRASFHCSGGGGTTIPAFCPPGDQLVFAIEFPRCWDGLHRDSPDHRSHVAYSDGGGCPASHPVAIPQIRYNIHYRVNEGDDVSKWRLSSDDYDWSMPGGHSAHADWMNGWAQSKLRMMVTECLNAGKDCGTDSINGRALLHR
jgi:hypothetical protein